MKIKLVKEIAIRDHPGVKVGEVVDVNPETGETLIRTGAAELASDYKSEPGVIETRDPIVKKKRSG